VYANPAPLSSTLTRSIGFHETLWSIRSICPYIVHTRTATGTSPLAHAQVVVEDACLMIHDADGESWADALRYKMHDTAHDPLSPSELTSLLSADGAV
jgi:hypothetical protein